MYWIFAMTICTYFSLSIYASTQKLYLFALLIHIVFMCLKIIFHPFLFTPLVIKCHSINFFFRTYWRIHFNHIKIIIFRIFCKRPRWKISVSKSCQIKILFISVIFQIYFFGFVFLWWGQNKTIFWGLS